MKVTEMIKHGQQ